MNGRKVKAHTTPQMFILIKNICGLVVRENVHSENVEMFAIEINNCKTTRFGFSLYYFENVCVCMPCKVEWRKSQKQTHAFIEK